MNPPVASCVSVHPADPEMDEMRCQVMPSNMCSESQPTRLAHVDCGIAALYLIFGDFFFVFYINVWEEVCRLTSKGQDFIRWASFKPHLRNYKNDTRA